MGLRKEKRGPLVHARLVGYDTVVWFDRTRPPVIDVHEDDSGYTIQEPDRLDSIAYRFYGDEQLGWVIARRNDLNRIPDDLVPGKRIYIPTLTSLTERGVV